MKYLILAFLLISGIHSMGQFTKGDKVLGGAFYYDFFSYGPDAEEKDKNSHFRITPTFGVMLTKNIEVGGLFNYSYDLQKYVYTSGVREYQTHSYSPGIYAQKYFTITEKFFFAIKGETGYYVSKRKVRNDTPGDATSEDKSNSINLDFEPGLIFFPSPNLAIQGRLGGIGYRHRWNTDNTTGNSFSANFGNISLGILYYLRTKTTE